MNQQAKEAYKILNEFIVDLIVGTRSLQLFDSPFFSKKIKDTTRVGINRMCLSHIFLTLYKWLEFYERYNKIIPRDCIPSCRSLRKEIEKREIDKFRNKFVGHIWDKEKNRPLTIKEIDDYISKIMGEDHSSFLNWVNNPEGNTFPNTVLSIIQHISIRIKEDYHIANSKPLSL